MSPLDTTDKQSFTSAQRRVFKGEKKDASERDATRRKTRAARNRLAAVARELHAAVGHKCPDCGRNAVYEPPAGDERPPAGLEGDELRAWQRKRAQRGAYVCPHDGQVVSRSLMIRGAVCGLKPLPMQNVRIESRGHSLETGEARAGVAGVRRCRKFWSCPSCANSRRIEDATTITAAVQGYRNELAGRRVYLVTLTVPHTAGQSLKSLRTGVTTAYWKALSGKRFKLLRARHAIRATLRRLEVTHSSLNGWHPHIHALWFTERPWGAEELSTFADTIRAYFGHALEAQGLEAPAPWCVDVQEAVDPGDYLAKMGVLELAGDADVKQARCRGCRCVQETRWCAETTTRRCVVCNEGVSRSTWQILEDYAEHRSPQDRGILRKYIHGIRGARMLTWSRFDVRLRDDYPHEDPAQLELAEAAEKKPPLTLTREAAAEILRDHVRLSGILDAYERHDRAELERLLGDHMPAAAYPLYEPDDPEPDDPEMWGRLTFDERNELHQALSP